MAYEVVCVEVDEGSQYYGVDCRCITEIGYDRGEELIRKKTEEIHNMCTMMDFYVEVNGEKKELKPVERDGVKYVKTQMFDSANDVLLRLPPCG